MSGQLSNRLIVSLPRAEREQLLSKLEPVALPLRTSLFEPGQQPKYVHFMTSGVASVVTEMSVGEGVEVGLIGREGLPECLQLLGPQKGNSRCFTQINGTALRMGFRQFQEIFLQNAVVRTAVLEFVQYQAMLVEQLAACNRLHGMEERLARWLMMVVNRVDKLDLELTQEFLSEMLGTRRSTVTLTAGTLQRGGLIQYQRGHLEILEREKLEHSACECLEVSQKLLLGLYRGDSANKA